MRSHWSSRIAFILASVGSVVGLGNVWRFPYLAFEYGGSAFLFPYLVLLFLVGIPLLASELFIGQQSQKNVLKSFLRFRGVGFFALAISFVVSAYYVVILAWLALYTIISPVLYGVGDFRSMFDAVQASPWLIVAVAVVWGIVYVALWRGLKGLEDVMDWVVPIPIILLAVLLVRVFFVDGAIEGVSAFFVPSLDEIWSLDAWSAAAGQIFFSLSIGFGVMVAYGSFRRRNDDVVGDALTVGILDTLVSIGCGVIVFATLGILSAGTGQSIENVVASGPQLVFVVFPQALSLIPWPGLVSLLFFASLFLIGLSSQISISQAIVDTIPRVSVVKSSGFVALLGFLSSAVIVFVPTLLEPLDHLAVNYGLVLVAIAELLVLIFALRGPLEKLLARYRMGPMMVGFVVVLVCLVVVLLSVLLVGQLVVDWGMFANAGADLLVAAAVVLCCLLAALMFQFSRR